MELNEKLKKYMSYPFTQVVKRTEDEDGVLYIGRYLEIPEARTHGRTYEILQERMQEVLEMSLESRLNHDEPIPEPVDLDEEDYSGKFTLRLPKSLHRSLSLSAKAEGVSLNQYAIYKLAR